MPGLGVRLLNFPRPSALMGHAPPSLTRVARRSAARHPARQQPLRLFLGGFISKCLSESAARRGCEGNMQDLGHRYGSWDQYDPWPRGRAVGSAGPIAGPAMRTTLQTSSTRLITEHSSCLSISASVGCVLNDKLHCGRCLPRRSTRLVAQIRNAINTVFRFRLRAR
jgi:hypothetical protein